MINWKVVVGSGVTAAVLSLLTGIISGVSSGTLLLRAIMWGVIFCGVGTGISFLISRYLPELFALSPSEGATENRPNVDIVLPDENPHTASDRDDEYSDDTVFEGTETQEQEDDRTVIPEAPPLAGDNLVEEVEELGGAGGDPRRTGTNADEAEELPDLEEDSDDFSATGDEGALRPGGVADIASITGGGGTVDVLGLQADSEEIAQAIRTALKKDQKG